jgi:hypothetical protein
MQAKLAPILTTILAVAQKHEKGYCYPSQKRILVLLSKFHHVDISIRTLNRYLRDLEDDHYFTRVRRHRKGPSTLNPATREWGPPKILFASTLYKIGATAFNWMADSLTRAKKFFTLYRMPKLATYKSSAERYGTKAENQTRLAKLLSGIGDAGRALSGDKSPPLPQTN